MGALGIIHWVFTAVLLLLVVACILVRRGVIPVNHFFGIRTPALMSSPEAWRAGHAAAVVPATVAFCIALICSAVGVLAVPELYVGSVVAFAVGVIWAFVSATKAARAVSPA